MAKSKTKPVKKSSLHGTKNKGAVSNHSIKFEKSKGQHILKNPLIIVNMLEKAGLKSCDTVMEVGPGTGNLTAKMLEKAKKVNAFEIDARMVAELQKRFQGTPNYSKLQILMGDVIKTDSWPYFDLCISNLPYQISSPFILRLMKQSNYRCAVLMVQKEFADRLLAKPGDKLYSRLSANVQLHCKVSHLIKVSKNSFRPPPKVDSSVVRLEPRHPKPPVTSEEFDGLLRLVFLRKNKLLLSNLKNKCILDYLYKQHCNYFESPNCKNKPEEKLPDSASMLTRIKKVLKEADMIDKRARSLDEDDLLKLLLYFKRANIFF